MTDMTIRPRAVRLLEYLEAVRSLREQPVRDVVEYQDRRWWAGDIPAHPSCVLTATGDEPWLMVPKAAIPPAPPVPAEVAAHLRTGVTDPEREPAFAADLDDQFADDPREADRLRELLRGYVEGPWRAWMPQARVALRARKLYEDLYDLRLRLQRESALIELVWGHGILSWTVDGTRVVHPLVTTQVQLSFDPDTGRLPAGTPAGPGRGGRLAPRAGCPRGDPPRPGRTPDRCWSAPDPIGSNDRGRREGQPHH